MSQIDFMNLTLLNNNDVFNDSENETELEDNQAMVK